MRILVVEDDDASRYLLSDYLGTLGHEVIPVKDGLEAWEKLQNEPINFVISDWMMPNLDGLELCKKIRAAGFSRYVYFVMLTSKLDKDDLVEGMAAGADDFIVKPFHEGELKVRIRAGERILKLENDLEEKNRKLNKTYEFITNDLASAASMQKNLLPQAVSNISGFKFDWIFIPYIGVAGDIFNFFLLDEDHIGFYLLDVAGHGIPSAMLSVTLSKMLSPSSGQGALLKRMVPIAPYYEVIKPSIVVKILNKRFPADDDAMLYFTMVYGYIDTKNGVVKIARAGHPAPVYFQPDGKYELINTNDPPLGLLPDHNFEESEFEFKKGGRFFIYSDGIVDCENGVGEMYTRDRLHTFLKKNRDISLRDMLVKLEKNLYDWRGKNEFEDDVTLLAIEMN